MLPVDVAVKIIPFTPSLGGQLCMLPLPRYPSPAATPEEQARPKRLPKTDSNQRESQSQLVPTNALRHGPSLAARIWELWLRKFAGPRLSPLLQISGIDLRDATTVRIPREISSRQP